MFIAFLAVVWLQIVAQAASTKTFTENAKRSQRIEGRERLRQQAEAAAEKAERLRRKQQSEAELNSAAALFRESARLFQTGHFSAQAADEYLQVGEIYFTESRYDNALDFYRRSLKLAGKDNDRRCHALSHIIRTYATSGRNTEALGKAQEVMDSCGQIASSRIQAEGLEARGEALYWASRYREAIEPLTGASSLFAQAKDVEGQAQALLFLGGSYFLIGERAEGIHQVDQALRLWLLDSNRYGAAQARTQLGSFAIMAGQFEDGSCNSEWALSVFQAMGDKDSAAVALDGLGYTSMETGDPEKSFGYYQQARAAFAVVHDWLGEATAITGMTRALRDMRQYEHLWPLYVGKLRLAKMANNPLQVASALADMAGFYGLKRQYREAESLYRRSLNIFRKAKNPYRQGDILIALAEIASTQVKYSRAVDLLEQALKMKENAGQVADIAKIHYELAYIYQRLHRLEDARAAIKKTIDIIESQRLKIDSFDSRASYFASVHRYYALYIQILMLLRAQQPDGGYLQAAFEASERSKVRALLDLLSTSNSGLSCDELLQRQNSETESDAPSPSASGSSVMTLHQVQEAIQDEDTVLIEYALGDDKSYVWEVDHQQIVARELPGADRIRKLVQLLHNALIARQPLPGESNLGLDEYHNRVQKADVAYQIYARKLSQLLLAPLDLSRAKRVLVVPDGSLQYIPFSALPLPQTGEPKALLIDHHEVVVLPSGSALSTLRKALANRAPPTSVAAVLADPVFESEDERLHHPARWSRKSAESKSSDLKIAMRDAKEPGYIPRLPGSQEEADAIGKALGQQGLLVRTGFDANKDYVLSGALSSYRIIHFATHGIIDAKHPEMSGLVLSLVNSRGEPQDGYLRLGDVYKLKLSADLVVLSGCNSALGKDLESEGIIGLPRGFLYAGARSVIASLWKVDDAAAAQFMKAFYERIKAGESPSSALQGAQLEMSRSSRWSAAFYWAAFVLQGDYN